MRKIVIAKYSTGTHFIIPKGIDLEDKTVVKEWETKWAILYIYFVDSTREPLEIEAEFEPDLECKYADEELIEEAWVYGYSDDEEEEEDEKEEEDDEPAKISKTVVDDIVAKALKPIALA